MVLNVFIYSVLASQIHQHFSNCCFGWKYLLLHVTLTKPEITLHVLLCIHLNGVVRTSSFVHFFCVSVCLSVCVLHHPLNWVSVCVCGRPLSIRWGHRPRLYMPNPLVSKSTPVSDCLCKLLQDQIRISWSCQRLLTLGSWLKKSRAKIYLAFFYSQSLHIAVTWKPGESWRITLLIHPLALYEGIAAARTTGEGMASRFHSMS